MYPNGNLQTSSSGEQRSSYQHYAMSQTNNEKPVIQREHEEHAQTWGQPSASPSPYPTDNHYLSANRLASSSSSLYDRSNANLSDGLPPLASHNHFRANERSSASRVDTILQQQQQQQQQANTSSYSRSSQQPGTQHFVDASLFHGFKFQAIPGFHS